MIGFNKHSARSALKDHRQEARIARDRIIIAAALMVLLMFVLIGRFYILQVIRYEHFTTRADRNRIQVQPMPPTRGLIYDRNGVLLAENRATYTLSITRERVEDLAKTLEYLETIIPISEDEKERFYKALKRNRRPYEAVPLRFKLTEEEISRIAVNEYQLEGVEVTGQLVRYYPFGDLFAHSIGYVGRISQHELSDFSEDDVRLYSGTHSIGKVGLEKFYEKSLLGLVGSQQVETNAHGRHLRVLEQKPPTPGQDLHLYIDLELQKSASLALGDKRGAVVALDVKTGGVLAFVSTPSYDPNLFVTGISFRDYEQLNTSKDLPLFNRGIQGQYPPGSTLKPMLALGGLQSEKVDSEYTIFDPGYYQISEGERLYRDWKRGGHGEVDLRQSIIESCDTFFYDLSIKMGIDGMHPVGAAFGLGEKTSIDLPNERSGLWPSRVWKEGARGLPWFPGDSLNVSIGQGFVLTTPIQLAVMTATLATKGVKRTPRLVKTERDLDDEGQYFPANFDHWAYVVDAMEGVVHGRRGTAKIINQTLDYRIAGKTGTAQVVGIAQDEEYDRDKVRERNRDHALFIAFAPAKAPEIAVAVIVENGEHGSSTAAPVARQVFDTWFSSQLVDDSQAAELSSSSWEQVTSLQDNGL